MKQIVFCVFLLLGFLANSQISVSTDVYNAINAAKNNDVEWNNQTIELEKLEIERKSVLNKYIPKVEASAVYGYLNSKGAIDIPHLDVPILGTQLFSGEQNFNSKGQVFHGNVIAKSVLFSGGQIHNGAKALKYKNEGTSYMMELREDEIIKDIILSYDQLHFLKEAEKLVYESEVRLKKENERVEKAIASGLAIPYDRDKIQLAQLELHSKKEDILHKQELLILKIAQATNFSQETILNTLHYVDPIMVIDDLSVDDKNEVKALQAFQKAADYNIKKEKGSLLPTVGAFGGYSYTSLFNGEFTTPLSTLNRDLNLQLNHFTLQPTWMIGVGMKWEIFSGFERSHKIEEAKLSKLQLDNKLTDTREKLVLQLKKNKMSYETQLRQLEIAQQREIIAKNNNSMAEKQYKAGLITITDRLAAENDVYKESLNKIETIIKQRQAALETYQSAGNLRSFIKIQ